ncbi:MAG: radical SAM protein [Nanoarchaeota archaeon]|nr:radical SAM protein [Nanoarchaeota archaeon]MBU1988928.1 radical SAM protein [Nanoarchaeota archaeon]
MITTFWLVLGYTCNNRCPQCYAAPRGFPNKWMNPVFAKEVMTTLRGRGVRTCLLIGGEPTFYPNLTEIISFGSRIGLKMIIVSNGRRFKNKGFAKQLFTAGLDRAVISLEGATSSVHNALTGRNSFNETTNGIRVCSEIGRVNTLTTICRGNSHQIVETIELAYRLGGGKAVLNCAIPTISKNFVTAGQSLNPLEFADVVDQAFWELKEKNIPFQLNATFPLCLLRRETLLEALRLDWLSVGCHMYRGKGVVFDPEENILPCTHFSEMPLIENATGDNGNLKLEENFWKIWEDPDGVAGEFRSALWRYPAKRCVDCEYWGGCIGGCPLLWTYFDPSEFIDGRR